MKVYMINYDCVQQSSIRGNMHENGMLGLFADHDHAVCEALDFGIDCLEDKCDVSATAEDFNFTEDEVCAEWECHMKFMDGYTSVIMTIVPYDVR